MNLKDLDYEWFNFINNKVQQYPSIDNVMIIFAEYVQYAFVLLIILLWIKNKTNFRVMAFQASFALTLAYTVNRIIELFIYRERPFISHNIKQLIEHAANSSFPSDHATSAIVIAATLLLSAYRFKYIWFFLALGVAFSRVWVGVHYPFDVIAGIIHGLLIALFTQYVVFKIRPVTTLIANSIFQGKD
ncbi:undecaprenyl-diphosphatase [Bacillus wiedmannii]|uniref:undecaprenyl-diphosphatase n=1 Tax=Bacillus wiedmannii TaxID=1890302 RepID=UPI000BF7BEE7|nr:undecaprenyl-diphosphatase [Bacillus wiedmannii]PFZ34339.1 undecaprenyl-diphosphatase [Bacillus wiedmannii]PGA83854.1 undecaprenyl-diphosphatase [Bacillus wiedmannii]PGD66163.1 undecaprenyl-diphosphatase [Bacillus wiedmannii]